MKIRSVLFTGLVLAFLTAACAPAPAATRAPTPVAATPAPATATPVAKATCPPKTVKLGMPVTPPNMVHMPAFVALELGYFKDENLTVEISRFEGGVGALRAMVAGGTDIAGTSSEPLINSIAQGAEVKAVYTYSPVLSVSFAVRDVIKTPADLRGKRIGIQEPNGFADQLSRFVLKQAGIDPKDVQFVTTTTAGRVAQLIEGTVDTGVLHVDQVLTIQKRAPNIKILVNMWDVAPDYQYATYAVSTQTLRNDPATVECVVRALARGNRAMYDPALRAQVLDASVKHMKNDDRALVERALNTLIQAKAWAQNESLPRKNVEGTIANLKATNQIQRDLKYEDVVDLSIVQKVVAQLGRKDFPY